MLPFPPAPLNQLRSSLFYIKRGWYQFAARGFRSSCWPRCFRVRGGPLAFSQPRFLRGWARHIPGSGRKLGPLFFRKPLRWLRLWRKTARDKSGGGRLWYRAAQATRFFQAVRVVRAFGVGRRFNRWLIRRSIIPDRNRPRRPNGCRGRSKGKERRGCLRWRPCVGGLRQVDSGESSGKASRFRAVRVGRVSLGFDRILGLIAGRRTLLSYPGMLLRDADNHAGCGDWNVSINLVRSRSRANQGRFQRMFTLVRTPRV